jgi:hypothetical protein
MLKKEVLKILSVINIVSDLANTGRDKTSKKVVTKIDHINKGVLIIFINLILTFLIDVIKFILPRMDLIPAECNLKIERITENPICLIILKGGYKVHEVPTPEFKKFEK